MSNSYRTADVEAPGAGDGAAPAGVQSVERALTILDILARTGEAGITALAEQIGVHKSTAFRLVATLESAELVEQTGERGKYRLGVGILRLAGTITARLDVVREARPICQRLAARTGETVNIAVLSGGSALYVDQIAGSSALQAHNWVGQHIPLHATSNGKVLLSGLPDEEVAVTAGTLERFTPATVTEPGTLRAQLAEVRRVGYAAAVDELEEGLTAVAAPIRDAHGDVIASLSVSGPTFRMPAATVDEVVALLIDAAADVSDRLGWHER